MELSKINTGIFSIGMRFLKSKPIMLFVLMALSSCSVLKVSPKYQLSSDDYEYRTEGSGYEKASVIVNDDSVRITLKRTNTPIVSAGNDFFLKRSFDIDIMTILCKYRPATSNLLSQLNTDFNGNIFLGYRLDRFRIQRKTFAGRSKQQITHRALTFGLFGGLGSASINPSTTNRQISDEYNALICKEELL
ncbi:MAG: hypothetical protein C0490_11520 [Marivirga sp.]|nr:hypothetical protein [Marivirga sp.]